MNVIQPLAGIWGVTMNNAVPPLMAAAIIVPNYIPNAGYQPDAWHRIYEKKSRETRKSVLKC